MNITHWEGGRPAEVLAELSPKPNNFQAVCKGKSSTAHLGFGVMECLSWNMLDAT